jgi:hypothetical protein
MEIMEDRDIKNTAAEVLPELPNTNQIGSKVIYRYVGPDMTAVRQNLRHVRGR